VHRATVHASSAPGFRGDEDIQMIIFNNLPRLGALTASAELVPGEPCAPGAGRGARTSTGGAQAWHLVHRRSLPDGERAGCL
jgi:hypothetical protein